MNGPATSSSSDPHWSNYSASTTRDLYYDIQCEAFEHGAGEFAPVTHPDGTLWENSFTDYAHRLRMNFVFLYLAQKIHLWQDLWILDLGCGRGRWSRQCAILGANVVGADISLEAAR